MTKEEYEKLLQSDYWKGYSYSLIKERNFTCEDCGRRFFNERNKLQVHHLVYRDANPWSYKPEEVIVLCRDCHRRRHGFVDDSIVGNHVGDNTQTYQKDYNYSSAYRDEKSPNSSQQSEDSYFASSSINTYDIPHERKFNYRYVLVGILLLLGIPFFWNKFASTRKSEQIINQSQSLNPEHSSEPSTVNAFVKDAKNGYAKKKAVVQEQLFETKEGLTQKVDAQALIENVEGEEKNMLKEKSTLDLLEERTHANVVNQAQRAGVSTEGSTSEILDRITHANVVNQAQRAGVSTEGSTSEILDRITHANVVKQAKQAGVSAEGSTSEILDRITHANVVKQAQQAGVSTEGSTTEILDRITRKNLERYK